MFKEIQHSKQAIKFLNKQLFEFIHTANWDNIPEAEPDEFDLQMLKEIEQDKDCHEFVSADEAKKILGLA